MCVPRKKFRAEVRHWLQSWSDQFRYDTYREGLYQMLREIREVSSKWTEGKLAPCGDCPECLEDRAREEAEARAVAKYQARCLERSAHELQNAAAGEDLRIRNSQAWKRDCNLFHFFAHRHKGKDPLLVIARKKS